MAKNQITIAGKPLYNQGGNIDPNSLGYQYVIDTLTYIRSRVVEQRFYEIAPGDYMPMDVGEGAWAEEIVQNREFVTGGSFFDGDVDTVTGNGRLAGSDAGIQPIRIPTRTWAKSAQWTVMDIAKAAAAGNWDVVEAKIRSLRKNWDLGIQEVAFLGHPDGTIPGLLTNDEINTDTSVIGEPIRDMSATNFQSFIGDVVSEFYDNSNHTRLPDTFVMPTSDYLGLGAAASPDFPNISKLEYMLNTFRRMTANENFKILPLAYAEADKSNGRLSSDRYVMYRDDPETLQMSIPVDFTMLEAGTANNLYWEQPAYGQYSGVLVNRELEMLYYDISE